MGGRGGTLGGVIPDCANDLTVVVPALNAEQTIVSCVRSVLSCHASERISRVIVVDGGSSDRTVQFALEAGATVIPNQERHAAAARQIGLGQVRTPLVAFLDADCIAPPEWAATILDHFCDSGLAGLGGPYIASPTEDPCARFSARTFEAVMRFGDESRIVESRSVAGSLVGGNCAFSVDALRSIGGFDLTMGNHGEDLDLVWRLIDSGARVRYEPALRVEHLYRTGHRSIASGWFRYGIASALLAKRHLRTPAVDLRLYRMLFASLVRAPWSPDDHGLRVLQLGSHLAGKAAGSMSERVINL